MANSNDIYDTISEKVIASLERGILPWRSFSEDNPIVARPMRSNDVPFSGINTVLLWMAAHSNGYTSPYWLTSKQAQQLGGSLKEDQQGKGHHVVYVDTFSKETMQEEEKVIVQVPFLKIYTIYNAEQYAGLPEKYAKPSVKMDDENKQLKAISKFFENAKAKIITGQHAAGYFTLSDKIHMPPKEHCDSEKDYYAMLAHEYIHWTRHPSRLNRDFHTKDREGIAFAKEELVAELGVCFLGVDLGFTPLPVERLADRLKAWLELLKDDKRFLFQAASFAQKSVEFLHALQEVKPKPAAKSKSRSQPTATGA